MTQEVLQGKWDVAVQANLLPNGKALCWGRRKDPKGVIGDASLNKAFTRAFVWDPATPSNPGIPTANEPRGTSNQEANLFLGRFAGRHTPDRWGLYNLSKVTQKGDDRVTIWSGVQAD